jgi:branched-chain amino acid transport system ATP-binding protein
MMGMETMENAENILEVTGVNKAFGGLKALDDVNLTVRTGTVHAIIGPNGAGKSTLLNTFVGRLVPDTGTVLFDGDKSLLGQKPHDYQSDGCRACVSNARDLHGAHSD